MQGTIEVGVDLRPPRRRRLPAHALSFGRGADWAFPDCPDWVPRDLLALIPIRQGWLLENGSANLSVNGPGLPGTTFGPDAPIWLPEGSWDLCWDVDRPVMVTVEVATRIHPDRVPRQFATSTTGDLCRTVFAAQRPMLTALQRRRMAAVFRYLLREEPAPDRIFHSAAERLGDIGQASLKAYTQKLRDKVNLRRRQHLETLDAFGRYLVYTARAITYMDLYESARLGRPALHQRVPRHP